MQPLLIALLLGGLLVLGCDQGREQALSPRSTTEVKLPPTPDLNVQLPPMRHAGGVWTIEGVLRSTTELSGTTVEVRGIVVDAHHCPKAKPGQEAEECHPPPHFYLADRAGEERYQLLVTGTGSRIVDMARVGLELTLVGRLDVVSDGGSFIRQAGVLVLPPPSEKATNKAAPATPPSVKTP